MFKPKSEVAEAWHAERKYPVYYIIDIRILLMSYIVACQ